MTESNNFASAEQIRKEVACLFKPPRRLTVTQAIEESLWIPGAAGSSQPWTTDAIPYLVEVLNCLNQRDYESVVFVGPARCGKTNALIEGWMAYVIMIEPADMLIVQLSKEKAQEYSKKRIRRTIYASPNLRDQCSSRRHDNNVHDIIFKPGNYLKIGWPTINVLSSSDYRYVALTDYDRLPANVDEEGDPYTLAKKRTQTFMSAGKTLVESSPGWEVLDPKWQPTTTHESPPTQGILSLYNMGDRRRYYWQCPNPVCLEWFQPIFDHLHWVEQADLVKAAESVVMRCPHCQGVIRPEQKFKLNQAGRWLKEGEWLDKKGNQYGTSRSSKMATFWLEGPAAGFQTWQQLVYQGLLAEQDYEHTGSQEKLKSWTNLDLGKPYRYRHNTEFRTAEALMDRQENLGEQVVPEGVRFLTAAIDVQGGKQKRFVVQVIGWGKEFEGWVIDRFMIDKSQRLDHKGKPYPLNPAAFKEDWHCLVDQVIHKTYPLADNSGRLMQIKLVACDSGGEDGVTDKAYEFYRYLKNRQLTHRLILIKGTGREGAPRIQETFPDNRNRQQRKAFIQGDIPLYLLNTNLIKDTVSNALERDEPGADYIHFPDWLTKDFFEELTNEARDAKGRWCKVVDKAPNEAWDLLVYNMGCLLKLNAHKLNWQQPPGWAAHWDDNRLVTHSNQPNQSTTPALQLSDLADLLG
ncbi:phage terminase large subunit family protein [Spartinivicinus marinus]|nr:terminase gpA endonuclease subunit [Spartinivicinus marinus]MCX4025179.1 phage terminase large subunit family protein [Spartinivicinus marinus]